MSDGEAAAVNYAADVDMVVCCGGDGTFNETISGILNSGVEVPVGYIPAGSTNDFAASLHLSQDILQAARDIVEGEATRLDVGRFAGRYFSYVASFGLFTRTSYTTTQFAKNILGHAAYVLNGIQELSQLKTYPVCFELPDGMVLEDDFLFGAISNSTSVGGVLKLAEEQVNMQDGKLELLLVRAPKDIFELRECVYALQQQTYNSAMLTFLSTPSVIVSAPRDMNWSLDGEMEHGHDCAEVECVHNAITIYRSNAKEVAPYWIH